MKPSLLKYVVSKLLPGPIIDGNYRCPYCNQATFAVLPPKAGYDDKWKCRNDQCPGRDGKGTRYGDHWDLIEKMFPNATWPKRKARMTRYMRQYDRRYGTSIAASFSSRETVDRGQEAVVRAYRALRREYDLRTLRVFVEACDVANTFAILPNELAAHIASELLKRKRVKR